MTQYDFGTMDPTSVSGTQLANILTLFRNAVETNHVGNARPSYVQPYMIWFNNTTTTAVVMNLFNGTIDIPLMTINLTSGTVTLGTAAATSSATYVQNTLTVGTQFSLTGGGALSGNLTLNLVNDVASPGNSMYYGTNGSGVKGWNLIPTPPKTYRYPNFPAGPGSYSYTVPANVYWMNVCLYAAGGGDGVYTAGDASTVINTGGWGSSIEALVPVTPGETVTVVVGSAGTSYQSGTPSTGGSTYLTIGGSTVILCTGGGPGAMGSAGVGVNGGVTASGSVTSLTQTTPLRRGTDGKIIASNNTNGMAVVEFLQ